MRKNIIGAIFLIMSLTLLLTQITFNTTGSVILENFQVKFSYFYIIGFIFLFVSMIIFASRQSLDAIIIPTGGGELDSGTGMSFQDRERVEKALRRKKRLDEEGYFVVTGYRDSGSKEGQSQSIYKHLREHGIKPSEIMIEGKSHDTLENVAYTLKKIKEREIKRYGRVRRPLRVAFVSYPGHLERFEDFEEQAIRKGLIEKDDFEFYKIRTFPKWEERKEQIHKEKEYESHPLRRLVHRYKLTSMKRYKSKKKGIKHVEGGDPLLNVLNKLRGK